jgi:hypothetical protein
VNLASAETPIPPRSTPAPGRHCGAGIGRLSAPGVELASDRLPGQAEEAFAHQGVKGRILGEPLARLGFREPEGQNLAGLYSLVWNQSSACTLATLSSRLCSLSVRVLILTVV